MLCSSMKRAIFPGDRLPSSASVIHASHPSFRTTIAPTTPVCFIIRNNYEWAILSSFVTTNKSVGSSSSKSLPVNQWLGPETLSPPITPPSGFWTGTPTACRSSRFSSQLNAYPRFQISPSSRRSSPASVTVLSVTPANRVCSIIRDTFSESIVASIAFPDAVACRGMHFPIHESVRTARLHSARWMYLPPRAPPRGTAHAHLSPARVLRPSPSQVGTHDVDSARFRRVQATEARCSSRRRSRRTPAFRVS